MHIRTLLCSLAILSLTSCDYLARRIGEESAKEKRIVDSVRAHRRENPVASEKYEVLQRKKAGEDSLYLIRHFLVSGNKFSDVWYKNDLRHGIGNFYYNNGQLAYSILYRNDSIVTMEAFTPKGEKRKEAYVKNGTGLIRIYNPLSYNVILDYTVKNYVKEGKYQSWYEDGSKNEECFFSDGVVSGEYKKWYNTGQLELERIVVKGTTRAVINEYFPTGQLKRKLEQEDGVSVSGTEYDEAGRIIGEEKLNEKGDVVKTKLFYSSSNKLLSKGQYVNEKKEGAYEYFHDNGSRKALELYSGDTLLSETRWHENGKPAQEAHYKNNELHGLYKEYYDDGKLRLTQEYVLGNRHGRYISYFPNGKMYNDGYFKNDSAIEMKFYNRKGEYETTKKY